MTDDTLDEMKEVSLTKRQWIQASFTLHVKRRDYDDGSFLDEAVRELVDEIGEDADIAHADLEEYRQQLIDDPDATYGGEADER